MVCKRIFLVLLAVYLTQAEESNVMEAMEIYEDYDLSHSPSHSSKSHSPESTSSPKPDSVSVSEPLTDASLQISTDTSTQPEPVSKPYTDASLQISTDTSNQPEPVSESLTDASLQIYTDTFTQPEPVSESLTDASLKISTDTSTQPEPAQTATVVETKLKHFKPELNHVHSDIQRKELPSSDKFQKVNYVEQLTPVAVESLSGILGLNRPTLKINGKVYENPKEMEGYSSIPVMPIADLNNSLDLWLNSDTKLKQTNFLPHQAVSQDDEITYLKKSIKLLTHQLDVLTDETQYSNILPSIEEDTFITQIDKQLEEIRKLQMDLNLPFILND